MLTAVNSDTDDLLVIIVSSQLSLYLTLSMLIRNRLFKDKTNAKQTSKK